MTHIVDPHLTFAFSDSRYTQMCAWLSTESKFRLDLASLEVASADASFRRYFRIFDSQKKSYVVMDAPPPQEDVARFIRVGEIFRRAKVIVPHIFARNEGQGFLLLSDFGRTTYLQALNTDSAAVLYGEATDALLTLQTQGKTQGLPCFDRAFMLREMMLFPEWYVGKHLGKTLNEHQYDALRKVMDVIIDTLLKQALVLMHRDFHSRNLMVLSGGNPGILDFQDAVCGPITYDLASLFRDAYIAWEEEQILDWVVRYWERAKVLGLSVDPEIDNFYKAFEWAGLQRHLKILGLFSRLSHRDGKHHYLENIPLILDYIRQVARRYKALAPLYRLLDQLEGSADSVGYTF